MFAMIVGAAVQILDMILKNTAKNPSTAPQFAGTVGTILTICSRAAGETSEETKARMDAHNATVAQYAAGPPPGATV